LYRGSENIVKLIMSKPLVLILVTCLLISLILPAIEAAQRRQRGRAALRGRNGARARASLRAKTRARLSNARRSQARALREARARQANRARFGRTGEVTADNPPPDAIVVEDDSDMAVEGMGEICEMVVFTKNEDVIDFKFVKNNC